MCLDSRITEERKHFKEKIREIERNSTKRVRTGRDNRKGKIENRIQRYTTRKIRMLMIGNERQRTEIKDLHEELLKMAKLERHVEREMENTTLITEVQMKRKL